MKRTFSLALPAMLAGAALAGWGLFNPLVKFPVVGAVRYTQTHLGGVGLAVAIISLLLLSVAISAVPGWIQRFGWLCAGSALGLTTSSLLAIYRGEMDQLQQLADSGVINLADLLAKMETGAGLVVLGIGLFLWVAGVAAVFVKKHP